MFGNARFGDTSRQVYPSTVQSRIKAHETKNQEKFINGACCLCTGTVIFFLFSSFLRLLVTTFFLVGSLSDYFICKTLENATASELGRVADENLNKVLNDNIDVSFNFNLSLTNVLEQCRNDETIYTILQLDQAFDLTSEFEGDVDKLSDTLSLMIGYINDEIIKLSVDKI